MDQGRLENSVVEPALSQPLVRSAVRCQELTASDSPMVPRWATQMTTGSCCSRRVQLQLPEDSPEQELDHALGHTSNQLSTVACEVTVRAGIHATMVSVVIDGVRNWTCRSLEVVASEMLALSLSELRSTACAHPVRIWNFLPDICAPIGEGLDRYRVFNIARHKVFASWFGEAAIHDGQVPPASCVGHHGLSLAIHTMGAAAGCVPVENPRQIPAFEYSTKFGPRPPCFSRAGKAEMGGTQLLFVAGTASVRGEESFHDGSLEEQLRETVVNLRAVVAQGRRPGVADVGQDKRQPLSGVLATRVYYRRPEDLAWLEQALPVELSSSADVEFVHADICRPELLIEIEILVDVSRG